MDETHENGQEKGNRDSFAKNRKENYGTPEQQIKRNVSKIFTYGPKRHFFFTDI